MKAFGVAIILAAVVLGYEALKLIKGNGTTSIAQKVGSAVAGVGATNLSPATGDASSSASVAAASAQNYNLGTQGTLNTPSGLQWNNTSNGTINIIASWANNVFGNGSQKAKDFTRWVVALGYNESGGWNDTIEHRSNPDAVSGYDYGQFQLNSVHGITPPAAYDPNTWIGIQGQSVINAFNQYYTAPGTPSTSVFQRFWAAANGAVYDNGTIGTRYLDPTPGISFANGLNSQ
jgi:hypothetical protein